MNQVYKLKIEPLFQKYYNIESSYGIYAVKPIESEPKLVTDIKDDSITIAGNTMKLTIGKIYDCIVEETIHPKYGLTYKIQSVYSPEASSDEDERNFLQTLVTDIQFYNIIAVYPKPVTAILSGEADYRRIRGIGQKTFESIKKKVEANHHLMKALSVLGKYGITYNQIKKIVETYKNADVAINKVMEDPYILYKDVDGVGFIKADNIARSIGIDFHDVRRINAGTMYALELNEEEGHTWIKTSDLMLKTESVLGFEFDKEEDFIQLLSDNKYCYLSEDNSKAALLKTYQCELDICSELKRIKNAYIRRYYDTTTLENRISKIEADANIKYTDKQKELFYKINDNNVLTLIGNAGCGKTASVNGLLKLLDNTSVSYLLLSPTARAAQVLKNATGKQASTIHRGLGWTPDGWRFNAKNPLPYDLIIIDEISMVDQFLFRSVLRAIRTGAKLLCIGDDAQLPSIVVGNILSDLTNSGVIEVIKLDQVFRQGLQSGILKIATDVRHGNIFYKNSDILLEEGIKKDMKVWFSEKEQICNRVVNTFKRVIEKYEIQDVMVLSPMKKGVNGIHALNNILQEVYNPREIGKPEIDLKRCIFRLGDKVAHNSNFYEAEWLDSTFELIDGAGIFNGEQGIIKKIINTDDEKAIFVDYGEKIIKYEPSMFGMLDLAYALSVHRSQGSGSKVVIIAMDMASYVLLKRNLLYTAVTRASELCFLIAEQKAVGIAIRTDSIKNKRTFLGKFLKDIDNSNIK